MKLTKKAMLEEIFNGMNENQKARVIEERVNGCSFERIAKWYDWWSKSEKDRNARQIVLNATAF